MKNQEDYTGREPYRKFGTLEKMHWKLLQERGPAMTKLESAIKLVNWDGFCAKLLCDECPFDDGSIDCSDRDEKVARAKAYIEEHKNEQPEPIKVLTILQAVKKVAESFNDGHKITGPRISRHVNKMIEISGGGPHMDGTILRKARLSGMYASLKGVASENPEKKKSYYMIDKTATLREVWK